MSTRPIVIAHRGASGYLPEHTLAAKVLAHGMGADFIEQDVVLSADGIPVVLHDIHLDTTTDVAQQFPGRARADGRFYAVDFQLKELRRLHLHERCKRDACGHEVAVFPGRFPLQPTSFRLPTLEEEIGLIAGLDKSRGVTTGLYIELKSPNWHRSQGMDIAAAVLTVLRRTGYHKRDKQVFLQCFDDRTLRRLRGELVTPLPLIQLIAENDWGEDSSVNYDELRTAAGLADIATYADGIGPWLQHIYLGRDNSGTAIISDLVPMAHARGLLVHPYTCRRDELPAGMDSFEQLCELLIDTAGVDGLFSDFPDLSTDYIDTRRRAR